ncbi:MAG TPA: helix-turn-helix transcriptional regulator, partial [Vicinamibacterales bacterium]
MKSEASSIAARVRSLRRRENMSQVQLAERLGISPGYLNLIEHNRRPLTASLLIKLAQIFQLDLQAFSPEAEARLAADLLEVFGDAVFESQDITTAEVRDLVVQSPTVARAVLSLYQAYRSAQESADTLAMKLSEGEDSLGIDRSRLPTEEVNDLIQHHGN